MEGAKTGKIVEETLRQLEKDIAAARGLEFKTPVNAKVIARAKDMPRGTQGYYSIKEKTLYLHDDPACRDLRERLTFDVLDGWDPEAIAVTMAANRADLPIFVEWARRTKPPDQYRWDLRPESYPTDVGQ